MSTDEIGQQIYGEKLTRISEDQNTLKTEKFGELRFFETRTSAWKETCRKCLALAADEDLDCGYVPCVSGQRKDHKNGYFSIHEMPEEGVRKC